MSRTGKNQENGTALLLAMFSLLLLSAIGILMMFSTNTETSIGANYRESVGAYYSARAGLEEVRDRIKYTNPAAGGLGNLLPISLPGQAGGALYVLNPAAGEAIDPTSSGKYFDDEFCHAYDSSIGAGQKCPTSSFSSLAGTVANWRLPDQAALPPATPLNYKWIRVNMKTNRIAAPYYVDQTGTSAPLDTRVCWDGKQEWLSPGGASPECDANGMQQVYMVTALALTDGARGARRMSRYELARNGIRPLGVLSMDSQNAAPAFNNGSNGTGVRVPPTGIDGRVHDINGLLQPSGSSCRSVASMATDANQSTTQLEQALTDLRKNMAKRANDFCNPDGTSQAGKVCTPALWWVRGTDPTPRFDDTNPNCAAGDPANPQCVNNLNLSAPELYALSGAFAPHVPIMTLPPNPTAPFVGAPGNTADPIITQAPAQLVANQINAVNALVASSVGQPNYFSIPNSNITTPVTYGSPTNPAIVVATANTLEIQANVTGFGVLVVPNNLRIDAANFNWTGIVMVLPPTGEFRLDSGATGFINGALLLQSGSTVNVRTSDSDSNAFRISYSCDAIDLAFQTQAIRIIAYSELSY